jgi:hypothetical protein
MENNKKIIKEKLELVKLGKIKIEDLKLDTNMDFNVTQSFGSNPKGSSI